MVDVSVIVVNWNTRDLLAQCLQSVYDTVQGLEFEVFVVDNASTDGSVAMVWERFPQVQLIENGENVGFARANNQAIRESRGRYVLLLNSDALVLLGTLRTLVAFADAHPQAGIVGAQLINPDGSFQASYGDFPTFVSQFVAIVGLSRLVYGRYYPSHPPQQSVRTCEADWVGGACLLARREAIEAVGFLEEDYFLYTEELDWCYQMKQSGWKVYYLPQAVAIHWGGGSAHVLADQKWLHLQQNSILFFRKHHGARVARFLAFVLSLAWTMRVVIRLGTARLRRWQPPWSRSSLTAE